MRLLFSLQRLPETLLILRRIQHIKMYINLYVKHPLFLSDCNKTCTFSADLRKIPKYQI